MINTHDYKFYSTAEGLKRRKRKIVHIPREEVEKAVGVYLADGGKIEKLVNTRDMGRHKASGYVPTSDWATAL